MTSAFFTSIAKFDKHKIDMTLEDKRYNTTAVRTDLLDVPGVRKYTQKVV